MCNNPPPPKKKNQRDVHFSFFVYILFIFFIYSEINSATNSNVCRRQALKHSGHLCGDKPQDDSFNHKSQSAKLSLSHQSVLQVSDLLLSVNNPFKAT